MDKSAFGVEHISKGARTAAFKAGFAQGERGVKSSKINRSSHQAGNWTGRHPGTVGGAAGAVVGGGVSGAANEGTRQFRNKRSGIKVSVKDQYAHPYKSNAKWTSAREAKKGK